MRYALERLWASWTFRILVGGVIVLGVITGVLVASKSPSVSPLASTGTATTAAQSVVVPQVVGLPQSAAETLLRAEGLAENVTSVASVGSPGSVLTQSPSAGTSVPPGTIVVMTSAIGSALPVVPNVVGDALSVATADLQGLGFTVRIGLHTHSEVPDGDVVSTSPVAGTSEPANSVVSLTMSLGPTKTAPTHSAPPPKPPTTTRPPTTTTTRPTTTTTTRPPTTTTTTPRATTTTMAAADSGG